MIEEFGDGHETSNANRKERTDLRDNSDGQDQLKLRKPWMLGGKADIRLRVTIVSGWGY